MAEARSDRPHIQCKTGPKLGLIQLTIGLQIEKGELFCGWCDPVC